jgi:hypothetical protein
MKLHLGCGQRYLEGYVNVDFPPSQHTVQTASVADLQVDLRTLSYPGSSVDEIRLHHVFEHFPRHDACALAASWQSWLKLGGRLRIEVPDLILSGLAAVNPFTSFRRRCVAERHLFGSHEAEWAAHKEAYSPRQLQELLKALGFVVERVRRNAWRGTYNFDLSAVKGRALSQPQCADAARGYLRRFLVDETPGELRLLDTWMALYSRQIERSWARAS